MDLAATGAASIDMSIASTMQQVSISMMKETMKLQENAAAQFVHSLAAPPTYGHTLAMYV